VKKSGRHRRCARCGVEIAWRSGIGLCASCYCRDSEPQTALPATSLTKSERAKLKRALELQLSATAETDSSQWPSPSRAGAVFHTSAGADRLQSGAGWSRYHLLQRCAAFDESAKQRGFAQDGILAQAIEGFSDAPTFAGLFKVAVRLVELGGLAALDPPPKRIQATTLPNLEARRQASERRAGRGHAPRVVLKKCPHCGRVKAGLEDHIAAKHSSAAKASAPSNIAIRAESGKRERVGNPSRAYSKAAKPSETWSCPVCREPQDNLENHLIHEHEYQRYSCPSCARTCLTTKRSVVECGGCSTEFTATESHRAIDRKCD
jgi:hypothetical protein